VSLRLVGHGLWGLVPSQPPLWEHSSCRFVTKDNNGAPFSDFALCPSNHHALSFKRFQEGSCQRIEALHSKSKGLLGLNHEGFEVLLALLPPRTPVFTISPASPYGACGPLSPTLRMHRPYIQSLSPSWLIAGPTTWALWRLVHPLGSTR
jgi:hypothetical protein